MTYASVCSGIEAPSVAWHGLGWEPQWFAEIEPFPSAVLAHHYPEVPNHGDFTKIRAATPVDLLIAGTPCQSFSVAGRRLGLDDPRGNLTLEFLALVARILPRWVVWENVPGVLSDDDGRTMGTVLRAFSELGYGWAYRVLDAQWWGVPQRRRRVFLVGCLGESWQRAAAVLFEPSRLCWDSQASREERADVAAAVAASAGHHGRSSPRGDGSDNLVVNARQDPITSEIAQPDTDGTTQAVAFSCKDHGADASDGAAPTLRAMSHSDSHANGGGQLAVAFCERQVTTRDNRSNPQPGDPCHALHAQAPSVAFTIHGTDKTQRVASETGVAGSLRTKPPGSQENSSTTVVADQFAVRRLTPVEAERLQGFQDNYTLVKYRGKPAADGPRYKAIGNSMAVPVVRWIGERIDALEAPR